MGYRAPYNPESRGACTCLTGHAPFDLPLNWPRSLAALQGSGAGHRTPPWPGGGINSWGDALFFLPARLPRPPPAHARSPDLELGHAGRGAGPGGLLTAVWGQKGQSCYRLVLEDATGRLGCLWFHASSGPIWRALGRGRRARLLLAVGEVSEGQPRARCSSSIPSSSTASDLDVGPDHPTRSGGWCRCIPEVEGVAPATLERRFMAEMMRRRGSGQHPRSPWPGCCRSDLYSFGGGRGLCSGPTSRQADVRASGPGPGIRPPGAGPWL